MEWTEIMDRTVVILIAAVPATLILTSISGRWWPDRQGQRLPRQAAWPRSRT